MSSRNPFSRLLNSPLLMVETSSHKTRMFTRALRFAIGILGLVIIIFGILDPIFRDVEGFYTGMLVVPIALGVALLVLSWTLFSPMQEFGFWMAMGLVGQAAVLQLIDAGKKLHYQHYKPLDQLLRETNHLILLFILALSIIVFAALYRRRMVIIAWLRSNFSWWQLLGVAIVFIFSSATVSQQISIYSIELVIAIIIQVVSLGILLLIVMAIPEEALDPLKINFDRFFGTKSDGGLKTKLIDRYAALAAAWVIIGAALLSIFSYQRFPHVQDEAAYLYQSQYLANGVLTMPAPPVPEAFQVYLMHIDGSNWYPSPPPGWSAILAVGSRLGIPWLVNPVLGGINILLIYILLNKLYSRRLARIAILLICLSPWYMFMAMNFMTHTFMLTCALLATLGVIWSRETGKSIWAWLGGIAIGMLSLIRPLEGLALATLLGSWAIGIGGSRLKLPSILGLIVGAMLIGGLVLPYNYALTGNATTFPINQYTDKLFGKGSNAYGFGPDRGMGWGIDPNKGHSPFDALINANLNMSSINVELFGWSTGSLLLIALMVFSGSYTKSDYLMLAVIATIFVIYFFYYFSGGPDFGARYWYLMIVPLVALTVRGTEYLESKFANSQASASHSGIRVMAGVMVLCLFTLVNYFPWRAIDKYYHYLGMRPDIGDLETSYDFGRSLVLIRGEGFPDYASAAVFNPLDMYSDAPIYAWDRNPQVRSDVVNSYADRHIWIIDGPSITGQGFKVAEGPLLAEDLLSEGFSP